MRRTHPFLAAGPVLAAATLVAVSACRATAPVPAPEAQSAGPVWEEREGGLHLRLESALDAASPRLAGDAPCPFEVWPYEGVAGELLDVTMRSEELDAYLSLCYRDELAGWIELSRDDDGGGGTKGTDARLRYELPFDGAYRLMATSALPDGRGGYALEIASEPPLDLAAAEPPAPASDARAPRRFAVLVGVEDYPGSSEDLEGPANDVALFRDVLVERFGFAPADVVELRDARATRRNVVAAFREHLGRAVEGDVAVFYYSGHGLRTAENLGLVGDADPEADGRDEALYLADGSILLDDELGFLVDRLRTDRALLVLDSCFSGTGTRGPRGFSKRVRVEDVGDAMWLPERFLVEGRAAPPSRNLERTLSEDGPIDHVLLASSLEDQVSWTLPRFEGFEGMQEPCSAFTYSIALSLREAQPGSTFESLMTDVLDYTEYIVELTHGEEQDPHVEGRDAVRDIFEFLAVGGVKTASEGAPRQSGQ